MDNIKQIEKILKIDDDIQSEVFDLSEKVDVLEEKITEIKDIAKGDKGDNPTEEELLTIIKPLIPKVKDGYTPIKGKDYFDGKDGNTPTKQELEDIILPLIPELPEIKIPDTSIIASDASKMALDELKPLIKENTPTGEEIVNMVNSLPLKPEFQIDYKHLKNTPEFRFGGGPVGISIDEAIKIAQQYGGSINFADDEIPTGDINGVNTDFVLAHTPTAGTLKVYVNGQRFTVDVDYTLAGNTIIFFTAPPTGSGIICDYRYE
jgi:hypothetical protein